MEDPVSIPTPSTEAPQRSIAAGAIEASKNYGEGDSMVPRSTG